MFIKTIKPVKPVKTDLRGYKILLIEDERSVRELLLRALKAAGITDITEATSAEQGWGYLFGENRQPFHVMITDLTLPGVTGATMIKKMRDLPSAAAKTLPIIALANCSDLETFKKVDRAGVSSYLLKPISAAMLRTALEKALGFAAPPA
jgi:YesN/AraC family two-component response regulator